MNSQVEGVIKQTIHSIDRELRDLSLELHRHPELGEHEFRAHELLANYLEQKGFKVTRGAAGMPTAFIAEYSNGREGRRVGFCSEYDALPGIGHACGHNLVAITGIACAMAIKALLELDLISGSVILYGTPAEESTSGKITFVAKGEVDKRVDFAMMLHPSPGDGVYGLMLALDTLEIEFFGKASHAGMAPWEGVNALDALMQGWDNIAMLRQQTLPTNRLHGIITHGGNSANVIPDYAAGRMYARAVTRKQLAELKVKVENCFKAAAIATGCQVKLSWAPYGPVDDVFINDSLAECYKRYMEQEGIHYLPRAEEEKMGSGTTDMGNFSYRVPTIHPVFAIGTSASNHTVEFAKAAATEEAHRAALLASCGLAKTAATVFLDPALYESAWADFRKGKPQ